MRAVVLITLFVLSFPQLWAQYVGVGYYDLDALYDTVSSPFYNDNAYTPTGINRWTQEKYLNQIKNTCAVIDSLSLDIIGLYGVENEEVVRDIVGRSCGGYSYVFRSTNSIDGLDFALLYRGDVVQINRIVGERRVLYVEAQLDDNQSLIIILSRDSSELISFYNSHPFDPKSHLVVMGDVRGSSSAAQRLIGLEPLSVGGRGNYRSWRGWVPHDQIAISRGVEVSGAQIFVAPWMISQFARTNSGSTSARVRSVATFSRYFPIFCYININK